MQTRTSNIKKNVLISYLSYVIISVFAFASRTIFNYKLGVEYLGISGMFANLIGILSLSELGIGSAINFALYKPIAENDDEKIKSLLNLYKKTYRIIAFVILGLGLLIFPFLKFFLNTNVSLHDANIYYLITLFNSITSYFVSYKASYVTATQKNYLITIVNSIQVVVTHIFKIIILLCDGNYLMVLIAESLISIVYKILLSVYLNKKYPILTDKNIKPLDNESKTSIVENVKALLFHSIGGVIIHQTDSVIISAFVSTAAVGLISNYLTINNVICIFASTIFIESVASIGNLIAEESYEKRKEVYNTYDFLGFWIFGFILIAFIILSKPFITLWIGPEKVIDNLTMILFFVSLYLENITNTASYFKNAAGVFKQDKWLPIAQAIVNIIVSIVAVKKIGLPGVYVGTIAQILVVLCVRPHVVNKYVLNTSDKEYYTNFVKRSLLLLVIIFALTYISKIVLSTITWPRFIIMMLVTLIVPNSIIYIIYRNSNMMANIKIRMVDIFRSYFK